MKKFLNCAIVLLISTLAIGQNRPQCAADEFMALEIAKNPILAKEIEQINRKAAQIESRINNSKATQITIPVVVHVLYRTTEQNISDEQIHSQIRILNQDFNRMNSDKINTPVGFSSVAANCEILFCLAERDPDGNPTNGITRTLTTIKDIGSQGNNNYHSTANGGHDIWDRDNYLNIWVCETQGDVLGFAATPSLTTLKEKDGVVIGYEYFGTSGTAVYPNNKGRTTTHEVGHWLGLQHLWGNGDPSGGNCSNDDGINDTPNQDGANYFCPVFPKVSCGNLPNGDMFMNYMDYTDDACMNLFTEGQKSRILAILNTNPRMALFNSTAGCSYTSITDINLSQNITIYPNPASSFFYLETNNAIRNYTVSIYDITGKELNQELISQTADPQRIKCPEKNGIYFVKIESSGQSTMNKLLVNH